jgi:hypothetical protein
MFSALPPTGDMLRIATPRTNLKGWKIEEDPEQKQPNRRPPLRITDTNGH